MWCIVLCWKSPQIKIEYNLFLSHDIIFAWILNKTEWDIIKIITVNEKTHGKIGGLDQLCRYSVGNFSK